MQLEGMALRILAVARLWSVVSNAHARGVARLPGECCTAPAGAARAVDVDAAGRTTEERVGIGGHRFGDDGACSA